MIRHLDTAQAVALIFALVYAIGLITSLWATKR